MPTRPLAHRQRGLAYIALKQFDKAIGDFNQAQKLDAKDVEIYYNRGLAYRRLGKNEQAIQDYSEAIKLEPKNAESYNNRANAYSLARQIRGRRQRLMMKRSSSMAKSAKIYANRGVIVRAWARPTTPKKISRKPSSSTRPSKTGSSR
jgi:Flp pilus assembly protein TadD